MHATTSKGLESLALNLINGNLTDAKRQAKRWSAEAICYQLTEYHCHSPRKAMRGAAYLKFPSQISWQSYCDES